MSTIKGILFFVLSILFVGCGGSPDKEKASAENQMTIDEASPYKQVYKGESGPGAGKSIVLVASDHEYRSEETLPALARILAKNYGFDCTVLWGLDDEEYILPGSSNVKGLKALKDADLLVLFTRFSHFTDEEMTHFNDYLLRGGNIVALRTSTHAFHVKDSTSPWHHYDFWYKGPKQEWSNGFGKLVLGETWVAHYGDNHKQSNRIILAEDQLAHQILTGVKDVWVQSGSYEVYPEKAGATVLAHGEVLNGMSPDAPADKTKKILPAVWTKTYQIPGGQQGQSFTTTHGASEDLLNDGFRRMLINACLWGAGATDAIKADNNIDFVGPFKPTTFNFDGYKAKVKPADLGGFESLIMPGEIIKKEDIKK